MGIDHCCSHIGMAEEFLDVPDIIALFQEVGSERVAERMAAPVFRDASAEDSGLDSALEGRFVDVVASFEAGGGVLAATGGGEEELPAELTCGVRVFAFEGIREGSAAVILGQVFAVDFADEFDLAFKFGGAGSGEGGNAVLIAFSMTDIDGKILEVDVFDSEGDAFSEAEAGAIEEGSHKAFRLREGIKDAGDLIAGEDDGEAFGGFGSREGTDIAEVPAEDLLVEEGDCIEGLILG